MGSTTYDHVLFFRPNEFNRKIIVRKQLPLAVQLVAAATTASAASLQSASMQFETVPSADLLTVLASFCMAMT